ncbi:unnamed protein product [Larinioides sclopetarius]|uniref:SOCS box domain-containing protein n=1 Tax=Larinioides sclopetarius TaxID=280406 RepID=A0AAV1YTM3_9ARAC
MVLEIHSEILFGLCIFSHTKGLSSETIRDVYDFYSGAVGACHAYAEARSLKHLCRSVVRRMLCESGFWIPDGIKLTGVPRGLESFLNLED